MTKGEAIRIVEGWLADKGRTIELHDEAYIDGRTVACIKRLLQEVKSSATK